MTWSAWASGSNSTGQPTTTPGPADDSSRHTPCAVTVRRHTECAYYFEFSMSKSRKTPGSVRIPADVLDELNAGTRPTANLAEALAVDHAALMGVAVPDVP